MASYFWVVHPGVLSLLHLTRPPAVRGLVLADLNRQRWFHWRDSLLALAVGDRRMDWYRGNVSMRMGSVLARLRVQLVSI